MKLIEKLWELSKECPKEYESIFMQASTELQKLTEENKMLLSALEFYRKVEFKQKDIV